MTPQLALLFWSLVLFQTKHFACDFVLQTSYQKKKKSIYGHSAGLIHAGVQAAGSLPAILLLSRSPALVGGIVVAEFVAHYHIDWFKAALNRSRTLTPEDPMYWRVFGADQFLHQMTYVAILGVLARALAF